MTENNGSSMRLAITCGGTGGHFYPGLSIARAVKAQGGEVKLFLSGKHAAAQSGIAREFGIESVTVQSSRLKNLKFLLDVTRGILQARREFKTLRPQALLAMGSFASFTAALAAKSMKIPMFLHDGNARIGRTNRILSRIARHLCVAFPPVNADKCRCEWSFTGMPIRPELMTEKVSKTAALAAINSKYNSALDPSKPALLIFGGSQGARIFNEVLPAALLACGKTDFQVIHLTGKNNLEQVATVYADAEFPVLVLELAPEMHLFYQAADAVICRSGGSTVAELALFGKFAWLIPFPFAMELHQDDNARFLADSGAARIIPNSECDQAKALEIIGEWNGKPQYFTELGQAALTLARPEATQNILDIISNSL